MSNYHRSEHLNHLKKLHRKKSDQMVDESPSLTLTKAALCLKYSLLGDKTKTLESITPDLENLAKVDHAYSWFLAQCFALIEEREIALDWLENAVGRGRIDYPYFTQYDPFFKNIRGEERFKKLMERVKHDWENFKV